MNDLSILAALSLQGCEGVIFEQSSLMSIDVAPEVLAIPKGVVGISAYCCTGQDNLRVVSLPESCVYVGDYAFVNCNNIESVVCYNLSVYEQLCQRGYLRGRVFYAGC